MVPPGFELPGFAVPGVDPGFGVLGFVDPFGVVPGFDGDDGMVPPFGLSLGIVPVLGLLGFVFGGLVVEGDDGLAFGFVGFDPGCAEGGVEPVGGAVVLPVGG
ncbi:MAG: hypothetical protein WAL56_18395 [Candidatus Sulfotelmatobacter sp.]